MTENNGYIAIMVTCGQDKCTSLLENSYYYKDDKTYLSKKIRKLDSKYASIVISNIKIWQSSWTIIEIATFLSFIECEFPTQIALNFVLVSSNTCLSLCP